MPCNWKLKRRIAELYQSQSNFSEAAGVSDALISQVVRYRKELSVAEKKRWAILLRCQPEEIFDLQRGMGG